VNSKNQPASIRMARATIIALLACLLLVPALGGCDWEDWFAESEQEQAKDTAQEWTEANGLNPVNDDGSVNPDGVAKVAKRVITGSTGNAEVDAALNSDDALTRIVEADKMEEMGWKERDLTLFDDAVKLRPEDWKYRISRAASTMDIYVAPDMDKVDADLQVAEKLLGPDKQERIQYAQQGIRQLEAVKNRLAKTYGTGERGDLFTHSRPCRTVFSRLAHFYSVLADQTGDKSSRDMAAQYTSDLSQCPP
jgi:hypothetical protein